MSQPEIDRHPLRDLLSALCDGQTTELEAGQAFRAWQEEDDDIRVTWHAYHVIGDVLRSEDLATAPAADHRLLQAVRARLATEPVVLAPSPAVPAVAQPAVANARGGGWLRSRWQAPVAMAAGFLVVLGGLQVMRGPLGGGASPANALALANGAAASGAQVATAAAPAPATVLTKAEAARLAPYLAAHRLSTMNAAFQMPDSDLRNASLVQPAP